MVFIAICGWIGGTSGMVIALVLAVAMNVGSYWFSDSIVLRMTGAEPLVEPDGLIGALQQLEWAAQRVSPHSIRLRRARKQAPSRPVLRRVA